MNGSERLEVQFLPAAKPAGQWMTFRGSEGEEELWYSFFSLEHLAENGMDTKEIEVIKNHRPISHGLFFRRRSIGPLPSCFTMFLPQGDYLYG